MTSKAVQIIAIGPRADAEAAAAAIDRDVELEGATYSILEEDEDAGRWRIDGFPRSDQEAEGFRKALSAFPALSV
ncbi:MAG: 50S ribosomal protein L11 methyltransferase, partial [Caulobacteraceae bacterium]